MTQTIDQTLAERGQQYGDFDDHAELTQGLKDTMRNGRSWDNMDDDQKEALEMVAHKIGRIVNGNPDFVDSWTDIIGYTRLVEKRLIARASDDVPVVDDETCSCPACVLRRAFVAYTEQDQPAEPVVATPDDIKAAIDTLLKAGVIQQAD